MKRVYVTLIIFTLGIVFASYLFAQSQNAIARSQGNNATVELSEKTIKDRIQLYFQDKFSESHDEVVLEYEKMPSILVDPMDWDMNVDLKYNRVKKGGNLLGVTVYSKTSIYKKFTTTVRLKTFDYMVVANNRLDKSTKIDVDQVSLQRIESTNLKRPFFDRIEDVVDLQTKKILLEGKPIYTDMVELPFLIYRGDIIKVVVRLKNLEVTATGKALQGGRKGEKIKLENLTTGKKLVGKIQDEKTVLVEI